MNREEVAWCQRRFSQFDDDVAVLSNERRRQGDFFGEIAAVWNDAAARRALQHFLEPFSQTLGEGVEGLKRQAAGLLRAGEALRDSVEPTYAVLAASEQSASLRQQISQHCDSARADADTANRWTAEANRQASEARRLLDTL